VLTSVNPIFALAIVLEGVATIAFLYGAYWAFEIRKALASPIRRNLALWQGVVGVATAGSSFLTYSNNFVISVVIVIYYSIFFPVLFAYLDSLVKVARRSDPLLRSIIRWEKTRYVGWVGVALIAVFNVLSLFPSAAVANLAGELVTIFIPIPFIVGGAGIFVGARRIKDPLLKGNLKWAGFVLLLVVLDTVASIVESLAGLTNYQIYYSLWGLPAFVLTMLAAYCFYKSARSLAPISHFTVEENKQTPTIP
jgi:hypothetical protein